MTIRTPMRRDGFTLVELMIALVVMGGLALFLTTGTQALRSGSTEREAIHAVQSAVTSAQVVARKYPTSVVSVKVQANHAWVERDGAVLSPYYETLPSAMTASAAAAQVFSDGTLDSNLSTTLSTPEVTYALTIDRSGTVRVQ